MILTQFHNLSVLRIGILTAIVGLVGIGLSSCGGEQAGTQTAAQGGKKYGGIYRMNEVAGISGLDPARMNDAPSHHVAHQIYDLLVEFDSALTLQPELAERWEVSPDGLTYTYHLRKGVRFHDSPVFADGKGREMKASDVKYSFDRMVDARVAPKGASYFLDKVKGAQEYFDATVKAGETGQAPAGGVSGFRAVDDYTFAIDLMKPFSAFKYYPALGFCYIYPKEAVDKHGRDFFRNPIGTGPFMFESWTQDQELKMKRNPNYWGKDEAGNQLPFLDGITISFIKDEKLQINEFKQGNIEEAYRIPSEFYQSVVGPDGKLTAEWAQFQLHKIPALSTQYYGFLTTNDVFKDIRVRQAFNYAIDRDRIIQFVLKGQAQGPAIHGLVPGAMPGYPVDQVKGYTFDLEKARALMAEAGYPNGKGFPAMQLQLNSGGGRNELVAEAMQDMLNKGLGLNITLKLVEFAQHLELTDNGQAPFYRAGWIADYPDPENFLNLLYSKNIPPQGPSPINTFRYRNAQFDALFEQALSTQDDAQRMSIYAQAEQIAVNEAPMLFIYHDLDFRLVQPHVRGYSSNAMDRRDLKGAWFDYGTGQ